MPFHFFAAKMQANIFHATVSDQNYYLMNFISMFYVRQISTVFPPIFVAFDSYTHTYISILSFFHFWERCVSIEISWLHPAFITGIEGIFGSFLETWNRNHCIELLSKSEVPCTGLSVPEQLLTTYQLIAQKSLHYITL